MKFIKENMRLVVAVFIAVVLIIAGIVLLNIDNDKDEGKVQPPSVEEKTREEQLEESTGMTKEEAIEIVKDNFKSDNYEFTSVATDDGLYKVVITNIIDQTEIIYYVDPSNGMAYVDMGAQ